ncbi:hypothetical protein PVAND_015537 [Polypedilum vanderplanki]|uniref:Leucine-rich repeat domain-containing protein n=1 Tax=Polypedilum vanderplanki TaxID=319348 RepID=A0A9J6BD48_POLVA|nr:hypothetical protein PVAND_015537 [Polypedilum vanderplanki]
MPKIKCEFSKVPEGYICEIKNQYDFYEEQITFYGKHKGKKQNSDVIGLNFSDCSFMILPLNIAEIFPNLKYLSFHDCVGLESIRKKHLEKLTNLTHLYIVKCGLLKLSGDLLKGLKNLESVSFSDNKLTEIDPTIFDGLENLKNVNLLYNANISTSCITELGENVENIKKEIRLKFKR